MDIYSAHWRRNFTQLKKMTCYDRALAIPLWGISRRKGCIIQYQTRKAEIAPFPSRSKETLQDALFALSQWDLSLPSVAFAVESLTLPKAPKKRSYEKESALILDTDSLPNFPLQKYVKIKIGGDPIHDACRIVRLKNRYPDRVFQLDANRKWDLKKAALFLKNCPKEYFWYIEEPAFSFEELLQMAEHLPLPIAVDESLYEQPIEKIIQLPSLKAVVVKPSLYGGFSHIKKLQKQLPSKVELILSSLLESQVGLDCIEDTHFALGLHTPLGVGTKRFFA